MIETAISYGFNDPYYEEENRYHTNKIPQRIQLSIWKYDIWKRNMDEIVNTIYHNAISIKAVHLPLDTMTQRFKDIAEMMGIMNSTLLCDKFVVHPNKGIDAFLHKFSGWSESINLYIENFNYRKKKPLRNPIEIIEKIKDMGNDRIKMCFDTSHAEDAWFNHYILSSLLKHTGIIHLSNRIGRQSHLPFNIQNGDINLVSLVNQLKRRYKWEGLIVLEYLQDYHYKLHNNLKYLEKLVQ